MSLAQKRPSGATGKDPSRRSTGTRPGDFSFFGSVANTGPVEVKLYASTSARDADYTAELVDVHPDGYAVNLCDGIIRGRYRESTTQQKLLQPGEVYEFTIGPWPTNNVFLRGHRIRVGVASSNFPRFDRNPNTGGKFGEGFEMETAHQTVYHDSGRQSHVVLPVILPG